MDKTGDKMSALKIASGLLTALLFLSITVAGAEEMSVKTVRVKIETTRSLLGQTAEIR